MECEYPVEVTEHILTYILGGHAEFCVRQEDWANGVGGEVWYDVAMSDPLKGNPKGIYFVCVFEGDEKKYAGYFYLDDLKGIHSLRARYKHSTVTNEDELNPLFYVLRVLSNGRRLHDAVHVFSNGKCSVCGGMLRDDCRCGIDEFCMDAVPMDVRKRG